MFDLDPDTRISACKSLSHPYIKHLSDPSDEPELQPQDSSFENESRDIAGWKRESTINQQNNLHASGAFFWSFKVVMPELTQIPIRNIKMQIDI